MLKHHPIVRNGTFSHFKFLTLKQKSILEQHLNLRHPPAHFNAKAWALLPDGRGQRETPPLRADGAVLPRGPEEFCPQASRPLIP